MDYRPRVQTPPEQPEYLPPRNSYPAQRDPQPEYIPEDPEPPSRFPFLQGPIRWVLLAVLLLLGAAALYYFFSKGTTHDARSGTASATISCAQLLLA